MSIFLVNRHTRSEEDAERTEVLRSSVIGRHAPVAAAVAVVASAELLITVLCAIGFVATGYPATGSVALAASFGACGLAFTAIAAVAAQVAGGSRATLGAASGVLAAAFVLRAVGDIGDNALRWLSPIGWAQSGQAFAGERWWPIGLCVVFAAALVVGAFWISTRRDLGSGLLPQRAGPGGARERTTTPFGLALRLQRGAIIGWSFGLFVTGIVYGSIGQDVEQMIADNPAYADFLAQAKGASITDSYFATSMVMLALVTTGFGISSTLRLRAEEGAGRAEPILATRTSRSRWAASHLSVAVLGTVAAITAGGLGIGIAFAVVSDDATQIGRMVLAALVTLPAVAVLIGITLALFGWAPRAALAAWMGLAVAVLVELFGELLRLPAWSREISPLHHLPAVPAEAMRWLPVVILTALAAAAAAAGLVGFRRRDLRTSE